MLCAIRVNSTLVLTVGARVPLLVKIVVLGTLKSAVVLSATYAMSQ